LTGCAKKVIISGVLIHKNLRIALSTYYPPILATQWLERHLIQYGYTQSQLLKAAGFKSNISMSVFKDLPYMNLLMLLDWVAKDQNNPDVGFDLEGVMEPSDLGMVTLMAYQTPTLQDFIETIVEFQSLITTGIKIQLNIGALETEFSYQLIVANRPGARVDIDFSLKMLIRLIQDNFNKLWTPLRVELSYPEPKNLNCLQQIYGKKFSFDQPSNSLFFETSLLQLKINDTDPKLLYLLREEISVMLLNINKNNNLLGMVRACVATSLTSGTCNSVTIAEQLSMSQRSMVRHLATFETSLREIKGDVIEELAKTALKKTNSSIYDIALQMGFSETSSFDRVFKTKTGYTPQQYRKKLSF
jgi:AraC-like DNA-binding protein